MTILIKGMEIPICCQDCLFDYRGICSVSNISPRPTVAFNTRRKDCPLVKVTTPHGRLIDADALMKHCVMLPMDGGSLPVIYMSYLRNAPTIIKAEEGEE